jgi:peptidase M48-like protein
MNEADKIGEWLYSEIKSTIVLESSGWAIESVQRVGEKLQIGRPTKEPFEVKVPWIEHFTAFTAPGRYIYVSRRLLEMCRDDEMTAFVIAHEMAHHDLGHLDIFPEWLTNLTGTTITPLLTVLYRNMETVFYGPEKECAADRRAVDLCKEAGYDIEKCLTFFDVLEKFALDIGDLDIVFGPDESDEELSKDADWVTRLRIWWFKMRHGYLPIRDRRQMLIRYLNEKSKTIT